MPIPMTLQDNGRLQCPSGGSVVLSSTIGKYAKIQGIPIVETDGVGAISSCRGHPETVAPQYRVYCSKIVNPHDCKADKFKVLGKYVADAEKVNKLKTDKGFPVSFVTDPHAKPFVKR